MYYNIYVYKIFVLFVYKSERKLLKNYKVISSAQENEHHYLFDVILMDSIYVFLFASVEFNCR